MVWWIFLFAPLFGELPIQTLIRFPNRVFIETGSYEGAAIQTALRVGFAEIHSIELSESLYAHCVEQFKPYEQVHLILGDSNEKLGEVLSNLNEAATFWLDGHYSGGFTARGRKNCPLIEELLAIRNHPMKKHTILIDDARLFGTEEFDFITEEEIVELLYTINPGYRIIHANGTFPNDVLAAVPP